MRPSGDLAPVTITHALEPTPQESALEFFEKNYQRLVMAAYRMTGSRPDAEDLVQDIYIQVSPRWATIESPWTYVTTALAHRAAHAARRRSTLKNLLIRFIPASREPVPSAERLVELRQDAERVQRAFNRLPERQRRIAVMHYYFEYDTAEIAAELDITRQSVNTQIARVKAKLRKEFRIPTDSPLPLAKEEEA